MLLVNQNVDARAKYPREQFEDLLNSTPTEQCSIAITDIIKDVPRTNSHEQITLDHPNIESSPLYQVLVAYAKTDPQIGYTQGNCLLISLQCVEQE